MVGNEVGHDTCEGRSGGASSSCSVEIVMELVD